MKSLISIITLLMLNLIAFGQGVNFEQYGLAQAKDKEAFRSKYENQLNKFFTAEKFLAKNDIEELDDTKIIELNQEMGANAISLSEIEKEIRKNTGKNFTNLKNLLKQLDTYLGNSKKEKTHDKFDMER